MTTEADQPPAGAPGGLFPRTDDQELAAELYAIAAPVRDESGEAVAAVNLAAHASMISLDELVEALGPHLVSTADRISARLGYRRADEQD